MLESEAPALHEPEMRKTLLQRERCKSKRLMRCLLQSLQAVAERYAGAEATGKDQARAANTVTAILWVYVALYQLRYQGGGFDTAVFFLLCSLVTHRLINALPGPGKG